MDKCSLIVIVNYLVDFRNSNMAFVLDKMLGIFKILLTLGEHPPL